MLAFDEIAVFQPFLAPHVDRVPPTELEILQWCLPHQFTYQSQFRLDQGRIFFLPSSPNLMFAGPQLDPRGVLLTMVGNANWVQVLRVSERALRCMLQRNQIPKDVIIRIGRRIRFRAAPLRAWIERGPST